MDLFYLVLLPYLLISAVITTLVYIDQLPGVFRGYAKAEFEFQMLLSFITVNAVPLTDMKLTLFGMCPVFMVVSYV